MGRESLIRDVKQHLVEERALRLALLFGSTARGTDHAGSDVDVAILPLDPDLPLADELSLQARLSLIAKREVDLVRLDQCTPALRFRIAREGVALLGDRSDVTAFRAQAGIQNADLAPSVARAGELFRQRLISPQRPRWTAVELLLGRLAVLRDHSSRARRRRPSTASGLRVDQDLQDALCMSLLVAIQEAIDIAFHVSADEGWGVPSTGQEAIEILARNGVLATELAREMGRAASLRNRIVHGYASVDLPRLWAEVPSGLDALDRFASSIAALLSTVPWS